ncbi:MAG: YdjY domain-containing protein, partial [Planctomycetota bacterium]
MSRWALMLLVLLTAPAVCAQEGEQGGAQGLEHVRVSVAGGYVDLEGQICFREGLLELVATVFGGKEHESLVRLEARPRDVHLGLLMIGAKPGSPGQWIYLEDKVVPVDPTGSVLSLAVRWEEGGQTVERSVGKMVRDGRTGRAMGGDRFVFAGSHLIEPREGDEGGERQYAADLGGDVISLVSFPDEVLALPKAASNSNEEVFWEANTPRVPELGTRVVIRLRL